MHGSGLITKSIDSGFSYQTWHKESVIYRFIYNVVTIFSVIENVMNVLSINLYKVQVMESIANKN